MSECVVRMEMPTKENPCKIAVSMQLDGWTFWICPILNARCLQPEGEDCPRNCPIICQLPEGHGRLVDADELSKYWKCRIALMNSCSGKRGILESVEASTLKSCIEDMGNSKTIVPAEAERSKT